MFKVLVEFDLIYNLNHLKKMQYTSLFVLKKKQHWGHEYMRFRVDIFRNCKVRKYYQLH